MVYNMMYAQDHTSLHPEYQIEGAMICSSLSSFVLSSISIDLLVHVEPCG